MFDMFEKVKGSLKVDTVKIDNSVFRLHYKVTAILLVVFSVLLSAKQYLGDPIDCVMHGVGDKEAKLYDTYCWIHSTFSVVNAFDTNKKLPYPGVDVLHEDDEIVYHRYYQWVCFFLFLQAIMFYIPRYLWKIWECGRCKRLVEGLGGVIVEEEGVLKNRVEALAFHIARSMGHQSTYAIRFFTCEFLNIINVVGQIFFTDVFLGYQFSSYGFQSFDMIVRPSTQRTDPMSRVFPTLTKCTYYRYGPSGSKEQRDGLCVLSLNILNEKIFLFLFFWFVILATVSILSGLFRIATLVSFSMRRYLLMSQSSASLNRDLEIVMRRANVGDWFILYRLSQNIFPVTYKEFIEELSSKLTSDNNNLKTA